MKTLVLCCALVAAVAAQISTELPSTCASVSCIALAGVSCKEVLNPTSGIITGQCLSNVRPTGHASVCGSAGQPLYVIQDGTAVEAFCGRGFNRITCPSGYECNIAPNDAYAVCCPSSSGQLGGGTAKPGECPAPKAGGFGICANTCSQDSDCTGDLKCCRNECGATICQQPLSNPPVSACATRRCLSGTRCVVKQVQCIRAPCPPQAVCVPIQIKPRCPVYHPAWINPNCVRTDAECNASNPNACASGLLCCSTDCGRKCVRPQ